MLTTTLPLLPPASSSLLPSLHTSPTENQGINTHSHAHQRRPKQHAYQNRSSLALLSLDERNIKQRRLAIAMYGYSWLKPAGCSKTMLGRREEEIEREEVERQLREVEMQERNALEAEEAERVEMLRRQAEEGEVIGEGERDLDEEIVDMDAQGEDEEDEGDEEEEEDMEGDLDDDVPDADAAESSWVYDTTRDPDTESEGSDEAHDQSDLADDTGRGHPHSNHPRNTRNAYLGMDDAAETEAMVNAMLDEDELGELEQQRDLDEDVPDMDMDIDVDMNDEGGQDLDDDIPEAEEEEWQHTDTELEESEMDISILPAVTSTRQTHPHSPRSPNPITNSRQRSGDIGPGTTHEDIRRTSGNVRMPSSARIMAVAQSRPSETHERHSSNQQRPTNMAPPGPARRNMTPYLQTPGTIDSISHLLGTNESSMMAAGHSLHNHHDDIPTHSHIGATPALMPGRNITTNTDPFLSSTAPILTVSSTAPESIDSMDMQRNRRSWLNPAGARRNLFGGLGRGNNPRAVSGSEQLTAATGSDQQAQTSTRTAVSRGHLSHDQQPRGTAAHTRPGVGAGATSSGGLFTPSPHAESNITRQDDGLAEDSEPPRSRTRSGRLLGGLQQVGGGLRRGRRVDT